MTGNRRWVRLWVAVLAASALLWAGIGALGADETAIDMTGHWASPLEASGIDIAQSGSRIRGSSLSGLNLEGVISGQRVEFRFWRGRSYERADPEDRGVGVMAVAKNGQRAAVTWRNDVKKRPDEGSFVIVRVGPPDPGMSRPAPGDEDPVIPVPVASLSPEEEEQLDELYLRVLDDIEQVRFPFLPEPGSTPAPTERPVIRPPESEAAKAGIDAALPDPSWAPLWTPPPKTQEEWEAIFDEVLDALEQKLDSIQTQILDSLGEGSAE